jgi:hypothetical protein
MLKTSSADAATQAALNLIHTLEHLPPAAPFATLGNAQLHAIHKLASDELPAIYDGGAKQTTQHSPTSKGAGHPYRHSAWCRHTSEGAY